MLEHTNIKKGKLKLKLQCKQEQVKLIDAILEGLCVKELSHEGRKYIKRLRENLKFEIEMLKNPEVKNSQRAS